MRNPLLLSISFASFLLLNSVGCASSPPRPPRTEARAITSPSGGSGGGGISAIASRGWVDVHIVVGGDAVESVQVKCVEDVLPTIHTRVDGGNTLVVETDNRWGVFRWGTSSYREEAMCVVDVRVQKLTTVDATGSGDVKVTGNADGLTRISAGGSGNIHVASLKTPTTLSLTSNGSGTLTINTLDASEVHAEIAGSGDVRLASGNAKSVHAHLMGSGELDARALHTEDGHVRSSGSGECRLFASRRVDIESNGSGDIFVTGHPSEKNAKVRGSASVRWE